jgi:hypothetical protein
VPRQSSKGRLLWLIAASALLLLLAIIFWRPAGESGIAPAEADGSAAARAAALSGSVDDNAPAGSEPAATRGDLATPEPEELAAPAAVARSSDAPAEPVAMDGLAALATTLDRARAEPETERFPRYWRRCSSIAGNASAGYRIASDSTIVWRGTASVVIASREAQPNSGGASICQWISAAAFKGKRVAFSAQLQTLNAVPGAHLTFRADAADGRVVAFSAMARQFVPGTTGWTAHSIVIDVPDSADTIMVGAALANTGSVWVDDVAIEVVGADWPVTESAPPVIRYAVRVDPSSVSNQLMNAGFEETVPVAANQR